MQVTKTVPEHPNEVSIGQVRFVTGTFNANVEAYGSDGCNNVGAAAVDLAPILGALPPADLLVVLDFFKEIIATAIGVTKPELTGNVFGPLP